MAFASYLCFVDNINVEDRVPFGVLTRVTVQLFPPAVVGLVVRCDFRDKMPAKGYVVRRSGVYARPSQRLIPHRRSWLYCVVEFQV